MILLWKSLEFGLLVGEKRRFQAVTLDSGQLCFAFLSCFAFCKSALIVGFTLYSISHLQISAIPDFFCFKKKSWNSRIHHMNYWTVITLSETRMTAFLPNVLLHITWYHRRDSSWCLLLVGAVRKGEVNSRFLESSNQWGVWACDYASVRRGCGIWPEAQQLSVLSLKKKKRKLS